MLTAIRNWVIKTMMKSKGETGIVRTLPNNDIVELNTQITAQRLAQNGIDPEALKNADQVENAIIAIESRPKVQEGIKSTGKIFDMEGKQIDPRSRIMGGKQAETDAEIKARLDKGNKEGLARIRAKQKRVEDAIDNMSPSLSGDTRTDAALVAEDIAESMGKVYDDLSSREQLDLYDEAYTALSKKRFKGFKKPKDSDPEDMAQGGIARLGFKDGMTRRTFLKILGGAMAIPIVGKFLKPFRTAKGVSKVPIIKTDNVPGKPEWFDQLVNKVIIEGDDVTKKFATGERQSIHQKTLDDGSVVRVTEDVDDGAIRVEYDSPANTFEDTVQLQYKKPLPDEGNPNPKAEFTTAESGPVGRQVSPDDYDIDIDEVGGTSIKDLDSDVSKLKEYATGQKPTLKEIVQNKKRKDKAQRITDDPEEQSDAVVRRQGEMLDYDGPDDDFALGGRVGLLSGGGLKGGGLLRVILQNLAEQYGKKPSELLAVTNYKSLPAEVRKFLTKEQFEAIKKDMQEMRIEQFKNLRDMVENRQQFDKSREALKKMGLNISDTVLQAETKAPVPGGTTPDDLLMMEQIIKNLQMKDRKLNASGGLAGMLGE